MKVGRYILLTLIGGIIGGLIGLSFGGIKILSLTPFTHFAKTNVVIIIATISSIINILLTLYLFKVHKDALNLKVKTRNHIDDESADLYEKKAYLKSMKSDFIYSIQILISLLTILIVVLGNASAKNIMFVIIPYVITIIPALMIGFFIRKFDPRYPKLGEKNYIEKTLNLFDEGERHITLIAMYKLYRVNISLIIGGCLIVGLFSISTGINQTLSLIILIILFVYNTFGYLTKNNKFYK